MADFNQAIKWLKEGKKVKRKNWDNISVLSYDGSTIEHGSLLDCMPNLEATNWEIYCEEHEWINYEDIIPRDKNVAEFYEENPQFGWRGCPHLSSYKNDKFCRECGIKKPKQCSNEDCEKDGVQEVDVTTTEGNAKIYLCEEHKESFFNNGMQGKFSISKLEKPKEELKTLKDLKKEREDLLLIGFGERAGNYIGELHSFESRIKKEVIKWIKERIKRCCGVSDILEICEEHRFWMERFNITEEDLK